MHFSSMSTAYPQILERVLTKGHYVAPDEKGTIEVLNFHLTILKPATNGVPIGIGRKVGPKMMAIDGVNHLAGKAYPELFLRQAPALRRFTNILDEKDPKEVKARSGALIGKPFHQGMYGPRLAMQMPLIENELRTDLYSRRAIGYLWDYRTDFNPQYNDRPCAISVQFMVRHTELHCFVTMRSNDVWTGITYDIFQFAQVQAALAHILNIDVGPLYHNAHSLHLYGTDREKALNFMREFKDKSWEINPRETSGPDWESLSPESYKSWSHLQEAFQELCEGAENRTDFYPANAVEKWYFDLLRDPNWKENLSIEGA